MIHQIFSFGYKHTTPPSPEFGERTQTVIDIRQWLPDNPWRVRQLRPLNGLHPDVKAWMEAGRTTAEQLGKLEALARSITGGSLWLGCMGGKHRSVYVAQELGQRLAVPVTHLDIDTVEDPHKW